jgi:murein peptide amidase A
MAVPRGRSAYAAVLATAVLTATGLQAAPSPAAPAAVAAPDDRPAVVEVRTIGHSVRGRPIRAWRLGEPGERRIVLVSTMHGDEPHTRRILEALRDGRPVRGIDLWVLPTYNPDGLARGTRRNARGVDLNRNFPHRWKDLDGSHESGTRPASEPETRAVMAFLEEVDPRRVISFHQPLHGVDTDTKDAGFARRLARALRLPRTSLDCGGLCHGTMTMWFNHRFRGSALTVEYGGRPSRRRMAVRAPRQLLGALGAHHAGRG